MQARRLVGVDAERWRALRLEALNTYPQAFLTTYDEAKAMPLRQIAERLDTGQTFGAFDGADLVGIASLVLNTRAQIKHRAEIGAVFVQPKSQGAGAADALVKGILAAGHTLGVWQFELFVAQDNVRAIAFYTRHGFQVVGRIPHATYGADGAVHDLIMVQSTLPGDLA